MGRGWRGVVRWVEREREEGREGGKDGEGKKGRAGQMSRRD